MLHSGIDLHKNDLVISTVDGSGVEVERKRLRTQRPLVARYFASLPGPHRAVVESTASWYGLADLLREQEVDLTLAHAKLVKAIAYAKVKTSTAVGSEVSSVEPSTSRHSPWSRAEISRIRSSRSGKAMKSNRLASLWHRAKKRSSVCECTASEATISGC
jgi:transposase